jgi:SAM-dependent methyltransferase
MKTERLQEIYSKTVGHYNGSARSFWEGTHDHDVSQNIAALLEYLPDTKGHRILDFGCGPGRDLVAFKKMEHLPTGLDGSENFCEMAREHSDCEVWHQDFLALELPEQRFEGVFANASLFHVPSSELPRVLREIWHTLVPNGVLFTSNPRGPDSEGWNGSRYGVYHSLVGWRSALLAAGFTELHHYYRPSGLPREQQGWLATVWRK